MIPSPSFPQIPLIKEKYDIQNWYERELDINSQWLDSKKGRTGGRCDTAWRGLWKSGTRASSNGKCFYLLRRLRNATERGLLRGACPSGRQQSGEAVLAAHQCAQGCVNWGLPSRTFQATLVSPKKKNAFSKGKCNRNGSRSVPTGTLFFICRSGTLKFPQFSQFLNRHR